MPPPACGVVVELFGNAPCGQKTDRRMRDDGRHLETEPKESQRKATRNKVEGGPSPSEPTAFYRPQIGGRTPEPRPAAKTLIRSPGAASAHRVRPPGGSIDIPRKVKGVGRGLARSAALAP